MICTSKASSALTIQKFFQTHQQLMERFGLVELLDPKSPEKQIALQSKIVAEHILRCLTNNVPPTNPKNGSPLDSAEIQYILFHAMIFEKFNSVPSEEEVKNKIQQLINGHKEVDLLHFARAWIDIFHFVVDEDNNEQTSAIELLFPNATNADNVNYSLGLNTSNNNDSPLKKRKRVGSSTVTYNPSLERACYHTLLEKEPIGSFVLRSSSLQRMKQSGCLFDFYVITLKVSEGVFKDNLIVRECGRGWTLTGARTDKKSGSIMLDPIRDYFPCFFDALSNYIKVFSLDFKNLKRYSKEQILQVYDVVAQNLFKKKKDK